MSRTPQTKWLPPTVLLTETDGHRENLTYLFEVGEKVLGPDLQIVDWRSGPARVEWEPQNDEFYVWSSADLVVGYDLACKYYYQFANDDIVARAVKEFMRELLLEDLANV
jgi:hypothetical protein